MYSKEKINPFEIKSNSYNIVRSYITRASGKYSAYGKISVVLCGEESPAYVSLTPLPQANFIVCENNRKCTIEKAPAKFAELENPLYIGAEGKKRLVKFSLAL